jgi:glycosyltransferase involved in cell wall biosynthesis
MRVWIFNHYAETATGAPTRTLDLCRVLARSGHEITIFACSFSHHRLREEHLSKWQAFSRSEECDGVRFIWLRATPYEANDWRRVVNMLQYGSLAFLSGLVLRRRPDVVVGCSVHPLAALVALAVARIRGSRFFVEVTDLWPQVLIDFGRLKANGLVARTLYAIEKLLYSRAERIIMLWRNTQNYVRSIGVDPEKIVWIPHVVDPSRYPPSDAGHRTTDAFTAMYVGSFVRSTALDTILDAARILGNRGRSDIRLILIGGGSDKSRLMARAAALDLTNLSIQPPIPRSDVPSLLREADCLVCTFKNSPVYQYGLSMNKMCDYLMSARPVVFAGHSAYDPVAESGAGLSISGENPQALADALEVLADASDERRRQMGRAGVRWVTEHHHVNRLARRLETILFPGADVVPEVSRIR